MSAPLFPMVTSSNLEYLCGEIISHLSNQTLLNTETPFAGGSGPVLSGAYEALPEERGQPKG